MSSTTVMNLVSNFVVPHLYYGSNAERHWNDQHREELSQLDSIDSSSNVCSSGIIHLGNCLEPSKDTRREYHQMVYDVVAWLKLAAKSEELANLFTLLRFFHGGDYNGTAVGVYRRTKLIVYIEDRSLSCQESSKLVQDWLMSAIGIKSSREIDSINMTVVPGESYFSIIKPTMDGSDEMKLTVEFCDAKYSVKEGELVEKLTEAIRDLQTSKEPSDIRPSLLEFKTVLLKYVPASWKAFIRFCIYWTAINGGTSSRIQHFCEESCLKILIKRDPSMMNDQLNYAFVFFDYILCLIDPNSRQKFNQVTLPAYFFQSCGPLSHNPRYESYGPQPVVPISWDKVEGHNSLEFCGLLDRSVDLMKDLRSSEWASITQAALKLYHIENDQGKSITWINCFSEAKTRQELFEVSTSSVFHYLMLTTGVVLGTVFGFLATMVWYLLKPDGSLSYSKLIYAIDSVERSCINGTNWLLDHNLQMIVDSHLFSVVEDNVNLMLESVVQLPSVWDSVVKEEWQISLGYQKSQVENMASNMYRQASKELIKIKAKLELNFTE